MKNALTKKHDLVGVSSWTYGCAVVSVFFAVHKISHSPSQDGLYGVYAEVAKHRTWIDEKIAANGGASFCSS